MNVRPSHSKSWHLATLLAAGAACAPDPVEPGVKPPEGVSPLAVVMTAPADGAAAVGLSASLLIQFSKPVSEASIAVAIAPEAALGAGTLSADGTEVSYADVALAADTNYTVTVLATGKAGEQRPGRHTFSFATRGAAAADTARPTLVSSAPASGALAVPVGQALVLTFSEPMDPAGVTVESTPEHDFGAPVWSQNDTVATWFAAPAPLAEGQAYSLTIAGADKAGNLLQAAAPITFTAAAAADSTPPTVIATTPAAAATGVSTNTSVSVTFSEAMDKASVDAALSLSPAGSGIVTWDPSNTLRTLAAKGLAANTQYTLTVGVGAKDAAGNALAAPFVLTFTTGAAPDLVAPQVVSSLPADAEVGQTRTANIRVTFSEPMDKAATQAAFAITVPAGFGAGTFSWSADGRSMTFNPLGTFPYGMSVSWRVNTGAADLAGNALPQTVSRTFNVIKQGTLVVSSVSASDGYIRTDGPQVLANYATTHAGDFGGGETMRAFFTFNLGGLPANTARITLAAIYLYQMQLKGDPAAALGGAAKLERINYGESLDGADYDVARYTGFNDSVEFVAGASNGWRSNSQLALGVWNDFQNRASRGNLTQYRLRYPQEGLAGVNYVSFYTGESLDTDCPRPNPAASGSSCKAHLVLVYEYP